MIRPMQSIVAICAIVLLAGCSNACRNTGAAPAIAPGFYRHADEPTVYNVMSPQSYCSVISMSQMEAFGGTSQVHVLASSVDFLASQRQPATACAWPDGRYQQAGAQFVIRVSGDWACKEAPGHGRAANVPATDNPLAGKKLVACSALPPG